jgi:hypothetical protein
MPGGSRFRRPGELVALARERYRFVRTSCARFDEVAAGDATVVYCYGTLAGEWLDGSAFAGVRFIDRFTVEGGRLLDQQVWNDLAEHRSPRP